MLPHVHKVSIIFQRQVLCLRTHSFILIHGNLEKYCLHLLPVILKPCVLPAYTPLELVVYVIE